MVENALQNIYLGEKSKEQNDVYSISYATICLITGKKLMYICVCESKESTVIKSMYSEGDQLGFVPQSPHL